jgi:hypothetical protein
MRILSQRYKMASEATFKYKSRMTPPEKLSSFDSMP